LIQSVFRRLTTGSFENSLMASPALESEFDLPQYFRHALELIVPHALAATGSKSPEDRLNEPHCRSHPRGFSFWPALIVVVSFVSTLFSTTETSFANDIENVVLIVSDDLKASVLGCYGDPFCNTPNIDRIAERGMLFQRAYCQGVVCGPSRRSFMRSRYRDSAGSTLGEHFQSNGWYSARVGKIFHMRVPGDIIAGTNGDDVAACWSERHNAPGLEAHTPGEYACLNLNIFSTSLKNRESTKTKNRMFVTVRYEGDGSDQPDAKAANKAVELLRRHSSKPFLMCVGFVRPHYPMVAPHQYFEPYPWQSMPVPKSIPSDEDDIPPLGLAGTRNTKNPIGNYPDNQKRMWSGYYASVAFMDAQVGRVLDEIERLGIEDKTAIVFMSDHGYHLGEHGFWQKANLHEEVIRVPLIISAPGFRPGKSNSLVELVDVYPTVCELAGFAAPDTVQGRSLVPVLQSAEESIREHALSFDKGTSLRTQDWHYIRYRDETEELYHLASDPNEFHNLASQDNHREKKLELATQLRERNRLHGLK
ncbi:MAG: sulfatase, partial [Planctomycetota bacterium]